MKRFFSILLIIAVLCYPALALAGTAGSAGDPLVTKSWVDSYVDTKFSRLEEAVAALRAAIEAALSGAQEIVLTINSPYAKLDGSSARIDSANLEIVPYIDANSRTMVPIRFLAEAMGAKVEWNATSRTVTILARDTSVVMVVGSKVYTVNGVKKTMDTAPVIRQGWDRTMVPARFVGEAFSYAVAWNNATRTVTIVR